LTKGISIYVNVIYSWYQKRWSPYESFLTNNTAGTKQEHKVHLAHKEY